jgi:hypothetical protein
MRFELAKTTLPGPESLGHLLVFLACFLCCSYCFDGRCFECCWNFPDFFAAVTAWQFVRLDRHLKNWKIKIKVTIALVFEVPIGLCLSLHRPN